MEEGRIKQMKKIYDKNVYFKIEGVYKDFVDTSIWKHICLKSDNEVLDETNYVTYSTFTDLYNAIQNDKIPNAEISLTLFKNRQKIYLSNAVDFCHYSMTEKDFKPVTVWTFFKEIKDASFDFLSRNLTADEFIEYCSERNICPMKK